MKNYYFLLTFLFCNQQKVLFLALLSQYVFVVKKICSCDSLVWIIQFFLVHGNTTALGKLAHLAF